MAKSEIQLPSRTDFDAATETKPHADAEGFSQANAENDSEGDRQRKLRSRRQRQNVREKGRKEICGGEEGFELIKRRKLPTA